MYNPWSWNLHFPPFKYCKSHKYAMSGGHLQSLRKLPSYIFVWCTNDAGWEVSMDQYKCNVNSNIGQDFPNHVISLCSRGVSPSLRKLSDSLIKTRPTSPIVVRDLEDNRRGSGSMTVQIPHYYTCSSSPHIHDDEGDYFKWYTFCEFFFLQGSI